MRLIAPENTVVQRKLEYSSFFYYFGACSIGKDRDPDLRSVGSFRVNWTLFSGLDCCHVDEVIKSRTHRASCTKSQQALSPSTWAYHNVYKNDFYPPPPPYTHKVPSKVSFLPSPGQASLASHFLVLTTLTHYSLTHGSQHTLPVFGASCLHPPPPLLWSPCKEAIGLLGIHCTQVKRYFPGTTSYYYKYL